MGLWDVLQQEKADQVHGDQEWSDVRRQPVKMSRDERLRQRLLERRGMKIGDERKHQGSRDEEFTPRGRGNAIYEEDRRGKMVASHDQKAQLTEQPHMESQPQGKPNGLGSPFDSPEKAIRTNLNQDQEENHRFGHASLVISSEQSNPTAMETNDLQRRKKLEYAKELETQMEEKRRRELQEKRVAHVVNPGLVRTNESMPDEQQRRKQEYALALEMQIQEKHRQQQQLERQASDSLSRVPDQSMEQMMKHRRQQEYAQELEMQIMERQRKKSLETSAHHGSNGFLPVNNYEDEKHQKQQEYARALERQIQEKERQQQVERTLRFGHPSQESGGIYSHQPRRQVQQEYARELERQIIEKRSHPIGEAYDANGGLGTGLYQGPPVARFEGSMERQRPSEGFPSSLQQTQVPHYHHQFQQHQQRQRAPPGLSWEEQERAQKIAQQQAYRAELERQLREKERIKSMAEQAKSQGWSHQARAEMKYVAGNSLISPLYQPSFQVPMQIPQQPPMQAPAPEIVLPPGSGIVGPRLYPHGPPGRRPPVDFPPYNIPSDSAYEMGNQPQLVRQPPIQDTFAPDYDFAFASPPRTVVNARMPGPTNLPDNNGAQRYGKPRVSVANPSSEEEIARRRQKQQQQQAELANQIEQVRMRKRAEKELQKHLELEEERKLELEREQLRKAHEEEQERERAKKLKTHQEELERQVEEKRRQKAREKAEQARLEAEEEARVERERKELALKYEREDRDKREIEVATARSALSHALASSNNEAVPFKSKSTAHIFEPGSPPPDTTNQQKPSPKRQSNARKNSFAMEDHANLELLEKIRRQEEEMELIKEQARRTALEQEKTKTEIENLRNALNKNASPAPQLRHHLHLESKQPKEMTKPRQQHRSEDDIIGLLKLDLERMVPAPRKSHPKSPTEFDLSLASDSKFIFPNGRAIKAPASADATQSMDANTQPTLTEAMDTIAQDDEDEFLLARQHADKLGRGTKGSKSARGALDERESISSHASEAQTSRSDFDIDTLYEKNEWRVQRLNDFGKTTTLGGDQLDAFLEEYLNDSETIIQAKKESEAYHVKQAQKYSKTDASRKHLDGETRWLRLKSDGSKS